MSLPSTFGRIFPLFKARLFQRHSASKCERKLEIFARFLWLCRLSHIFENCYYLLWRQKDCTLWLCTWMLQNFCFPSANLTSSDTKRFTFSECLFSKCKLDFFRYQEPLNTLSPLPSMINTNKSPTTPYDKALSQCPTIYEIGSTSTACNNHLRFCQPQLPIKDVQPGQISCWNINTLPSNPILLKQVPNCKFCAARRFQYESPGFCCSNGAVKLVSHDLPPMLKNLYFDISDESNYFRTYIRTYNNMFAFI